MQNYYDSFRSTPLNVTGDQRGRGGLMSRQAEASRRRDRLEEEKELLPMEMSRLQLSRGREEFKEFQAGAGQRSAERGFGEEQALFGMAQAQVGRAAIGNVQQAGQRAYTMGRETEELERLRMASQGQRLQSQMAFQPQMDALRGGIMGRMAGRLGVQLPQMGQSYESGTGYTPSWMQSYQSPQFPRY
jgi:hypothetical protein